MSGSSEALDLCETSTTLRNAARFGDLDELKEVLRVAREADDKSLQKVLALGDEYSGNTALHYSAANGHVEIVDTLLSNGAPVDATNLAGSTPLHYCAASSSVECAQKLLSNGADAFVVNGGGATALDDAMKIGGGPEGPVSKLLLSVADKRASEADEVHGLVDETGSEEAENGASE